MAKRLSSKPLGIRLKQLLLPMALAAIILPFLIIAVVSGFSSSLFPRAAEQNTVRIWLEPTNVIAKKGQAVTLTVMAAFDKTDAIIPSVHVSFQTDAKSQASPPTITYQRPLQGKTTIGSLQFISTEKGSHEIIIPKDSVFIGGENNPTVSIRGATVTVQ